METWRYGVTWPRAPAGQWPSGKWVAPAGCCGWGDTRVQWGGRWYDQWSEEWDFVFCASEATQVLVPECGSLRACSCVPCPGWMPGPVWKEEAHRGQMKVHPEGVVSGGMGMARIGVYPAPGAFLFPISKRWTLRGVSRDAALQVMVPPLV